MPRPIVNAGDSVTSRVGTGNFVRHIAAIVNHGYVRTKCTVRIPRDRRLLEQPPAGIIVMDCVACRNR